MTATLLCLHGMACTGAVWNGLSQQWDGEVVAPDLAGHGSGPRLSSYGIEAYADELQSRFADLLMSSEDVVVVGHSMGGAVALELAGSVEVRAVLAVGIKTVWTAEEIAGMSSVADKGVRWFENRTDAEVWFLKVSGLFGLIETNTEIAASGVVGEGGRWRLVADPETYRASVPPPQIADQLSRVPCPVRLGRGAEDEMVPPSQVAPFDAAHLTIAGSGHSPHVEQPAAIAAAIAELLDG